MIAVLGEVSRGHSATKLPKGVGVKGSCWSLKLGDGESVLATGALDRDRLSVACLANTPKQDENKNKKPSSCNVFLASTDHC